MLWLLKCVLLGHVHRWETVDKRGLTDTLDGRTGHRYIQQCKTCGIVVKRDLI